MTDIVNAGIKFESAEAVASARRAEQAFNRLEKQTDQLGERATKMNGAWSGLVSLLSGIGAGFAIQRTFQRMVEVTTEWDVTTRKLEATLKATGNAAGITAQQIDQMADEMQRTTLFDDEQIRNAAALMTTFRRVSGDTFRDAISLAMDMSTVMGSDLTGAIIQVGKAMQDPVQGATALRRVGVQLSDSQEALIKNFVRVGDLASAQKVVLGELRAEFGGAAAGVGGGLAGSIAGAKKMYDDFLESLARSPEVGGALKGFFDFFKNFFASRTLTTEPIEDAIIELDRLQERLGELQEQRDKITTDENGNQRQLNSVRQEQLRILDSEIQGQSELVARQTAKVEGYKAAARADEEQAQAASRTAQAQMEAEEAAERRRQAAAKEAEKLAENRAAVDTAIQGWIDEAAALRGNTEEVQLNQLARKGATAEQLAAARAALQALGVAEKEKEVREETERRREATRDLIRDLQTEADTLGMTNVELIEYRLRQQGATEAEIEHAMTLQATIDAFEAYQKKMEEWEKKRKEAEERDAKLAMAFETVWKRALENAQDITSSFFEDLLLHGTDSFQEFVTNIWRMWSRLVAQMAATQLFRMIAGVAAGGAGNLGGGTQVMGSFPSMGNFAHAGGSVPGDFQRRPLRLHDGLAPDEFPAILQRGEQVIPKGMAKRSSEGSTVVHVNQTLQFSALDTVNMEELLRAHKSSIANAVVEAVQNSRQIQQALATR